MIRVIVAARSSVTRAGLESVVRSSQQLELAAAMDLAQFEISDLLADVLLLAPGDTALESLAIPTLLLSDETDAATVNQAIASGVRGIISSEATPNEIEAAIIAVSAGLFVIDATGAQEYFRDRKPPFTPLTEPLSERELEVLELIAEGLSNKLIAHRLTISEHTVKTHVASILGKLGVTSRTEAISRAIRHGLIML